MLDTYEAIYEDDRVEWLGERPASGSYRVLVTVLGPAPRLRDRSAVRQMLDETRGAWDHGQSMEEVDARVQELRSEWDHLEERS